MAAKNPLKRFVEKNPIEALPELTRSAIDLGSQEASREWSIAVAQMLGVTEKAAKPSQMVQGELHEGEEISFASITEAPKRAEGSIDYASDIRHAETIVRTKEEGERGTKIEQIRAQIMQEGSSDNQAVVDIRVETQTQKNGVYEETYHEDLLRTIREKADNPSDMVVQKAAKRDFWSLAKQYGTQFQLGSERAVAQQVG